MGYIIEDAIGPSISTYAHALAIKNTIKRHWPRRNINGVEVFDRLYTYQGGCCIPEDNQHMRLYKVMGLKLKTFKEQNYTGIENMFLYVKPYTAPQTVSVPSYANIESYIDANSPQIYPLHDDVFNPVDHTAEIYTGHPIQVVVPDTNPVEYVTEYIPYVKTDLNPDLSKDNTEAMYDEDPEMYPAPKWDKNGWMTSYLLYEAVMSENIDNGITNAEIVNMIQPDGEWTAITYDENSVDKLFIVALHDIAGQIFEKEIRVTKRELIEKNETIRTISYRNQGMKTNKYMLRATIDYKFRRVRNNSTFAYASTINLLRQRITEINEAKKTKDKNYRSLFREQMRIRSPYQKSLTGLVSDISSTIGHNYNYGGHLRVDTIDIMKTKDFVKMFMKQIDQGHSLKKVKWWKKVVTWVVQIVLIIIIIIVSIVAVITGQIWLIGLAIMFAQMVNMLLARAWMLQGDYAAAGYVGMASHTLNVVAGVFLILLSVVLVILAGLFPIAAPVLIPMAISVGLMGASLIAQEYASPQVARIFAISALIYSLGSSFAKDAAAEGGKKAAADAVKNLANTGTDALSKASMDSLVTAFTDGMSKVATQIGTTMSSGLSNMLGGASISAIGNMTSMQIAQASMQMLNFGLPIYTSYINPVSDNSDLKNELQKQNDEMQEYEASRADRFILKAKYLENPFESMFDTNHLSSYYCDMSTSGLNKGLMNKYFDSMF